MESIALISVQSYNTDRVDKHGRHPVFLSLIAGTMPNRMILSGTMAERANLQVGQSALVQFVERDANDYGRQFKVITLASNLSPMDILDARFKLGSPIMVNVDLPNSSTASPESAEPESAEQATEE